MEQEQPVAGQYRLRTPLDSGGWSRVWEARDSRGRDVALKEIRAPGMFSAAERADLLDRAERAALRVARLRHPHILPIHDVIREEETLWVVMPLVRGLSLDMQLRERGPLPVAAVGDLAAAMLDALAAADAVGIHHGDLKPKHVLLMDGDHVLLTDFGSTLGRDGTVSTITGGILGTLEYLAPEQLDGQAVTLASDLFALGVTLYEAVEGSSPFRRETSATTLTAISSASFTRPVRAGGLGPLITRLLSKDPTKRPSLAEARGLLEDALRRGPEVSYRVSTTAPLASADTRHSGLEGGDFELWERQAGGPAAPASPRRPSRWRTIAEGIGSVFDITGAGAPRPRQETAWERLERLLGEKYAHLSDNPANERGSR